MTLQETGRGGQSMPDEEVLAAATADGRTVLTLNRKHFLRLHQRSPEHCGLVLCTFDPDFVSQAARVDEAIRGAGDLSGKVMRINRPST